MLFVQVVCTHFDQFHMHTNIATHTCPPLYIHFYSPPPNLSLSRYTVAVSMTMVVESENHWMRQANLVTAWSFEGNMSYYWIILKTQLCITVSWRKHWWWNQYMEFSPALTHLVTMLRNTLPMSVSVLYTSNTLPPKFSTLLLVLSVRGCLVITPQDAT